MPTPKNQSLKCLCGKPIFYFPSGECKECRDKTLIMFQEIEIHISEKPKNQCEHHKTLQFKGNKIREKCFKCGEIFKPTKDRYEEPKQEEGFYSKDNEGMIHLSASPLPDKKCCTKCVNGGYKGVPMTGMCNGCECHVAQPKAEEWASSIISIIAKLDNGSHSSNQLQGVDEAIIDILRTAVQVAERRGYEKGLKDGSEIERYGSIGGAQKSVQC